MIKIEVKPFEYECPISDVPQGTLFVHLLSGLVGMKTMQKERADDQADECIDLQTGLPFLAGTTNFAERDALIVVCSQFNWTGV